MVRLGVNIDHIATLRQARGTDYPDPVLSLPILEKTDVDQITVHLREDRRHIQDDDVKKIIKLSKLPINLEMALTEEMIDIACRLKPATCTIVPEKREEITTEGGLDVAYHYNSLKKFLPQLFSKNIRVSLFIDPDKEHIDLTHDLGIKAIELHTGNYCEVFGQDNQGFELDRLKSAAKYAHAKGISVFAGHGLNIENLAPVVSISEIEEYNIGHSIISRAVFHGLEAAILEIQNILKSS